MLETVHGSRLYGTNHEASDFDYYRVICSGRTQQKIEGDEDTTTVQLHDFIRQVSVGVPQALEALWSPVKTVDPSWKYFFNSLHPGYGETIDRYNRTIANFMGWRKGGGRGRTREPSNKTRLHALRLMHNLQDYLESGSFNPRLSESWVTLYRQWSETQGATENRLLDMGYQRKELG